MLDFLAMVVWLILTVVIFICLKNRTNVVSFNGATGFLQAYLELLIEAGIAAGFVVGICFWILKSIGWYLVGGVVIIGIIIAIFSSNSSSRNNSQESLSADNNIQIDNPNSTSTVTNSENKFCGNCGAPVESESQFCGHCGKKV